MADRLKGRTVREFQSSADVWGIMVSWANQAGYMLVQQDQDSRTFKRGTGFWVAPQMVKMTWANGVYRLEGWVWLPLLNRIVTLGLLPAELRIDSGGVRAVIPRNKAREQVSGLMQMLGQPPIL